MYNKITFIYTLILICIHNLYFVLFNVIVLKSKKRDINLNLIGKLNFFFFRIDSELRKWIEPRNIKLLNDNLSMVYVEPSILSTIIGNSKHNEYIKSKDKKQNNSQKINFK